MLLRDRGKKIGKEGARTNSFPGRYFGGIETGHPQDGPSGFVLPLKKDREVVAV
jgi:hypothetical protein